MITYALKDALRESTSGIFILSQVCDQMERCWVGSHGSMDIAESIRTMRQWGEESPWQRLFLSLISTVNDTHAPVDSFMLINKFK